MEIPVTSDMMWRMQSLSFLSALPALLGLAGFVVYPYRIDGGATL